MTESEILKALGNVDDPDFNRDIVSLNMVKDIEIEGNKVSFTLVLTTPACPLKDMFQTACTNAVKLLVNKDADVTIHFTSNTTSKRIDSNQLLPGVKNIIAVVSGKGKEH